MADMPQHFKRTPEQQSAASPSMKNPYYDEQVAAEAPGAITGTWSDMEQTAWSIYRDADRNTTEWALAEAVLVLLGAMGCDTSTDGARGPSGGGDAA